MHETAPLSEPDSMVSSPSPPAPAAAPPPGRAGRWLDVCLAVPRAILRRPVRSLVISGLLLLIGAGVSLAVVYLWAAYHLRVARTALERYHTNEALPHLQTAYSIRPRHPETLLLAARAARRVGSYEDADRWLDRYQDVRGPEDEDLVLERVLVRVERGEADAMSKYCVSLIERDHPAAPLILEALARGYMRGYQPKKAEKAIEEWLKRQPDNPQALLIQGELSELLTRQHDAIASYRRALTVDPQLDDARLRLSGALMNLDLTAEAQPHLEYLSRRFPANLMVQVYLARVEDRAGNAEEAVRILESVLARQPRFAPALAERGKLALRDGQAEQAEKWLREACDQEPGDYQAHYQLSLCLEKNGKTEEAQKEQAHLQQIEDDIKQIQQIVMGHMEAQPHDANLHYRVGMIALHAGSIEEALRWLHSALKEDPNHQPTHKALMEHYQRLGDFGRARAHRQKLTAPDKAPAADKPTR
ncbi:MAG TPA: tetratricopeptide repeat protein [Gemmataceae bacterium]|jgi:tetratricopeptide (TPR) repeat protein